MHFGSTERGPMVGSCLLEQVAEEQQLMGILVTAESADLGRDIDTRCSLHKHLLEVITHHCNCLALFFHCIQLRKRAKKPARRGGLRKALWLLCVGKILWMSK